MSNQNGGRERDTRMKVTLNASAQKLVRRQREIEEGIGRSLTRDELVGFLCDHLDTRSFDREAWLRGELGRIADELERRGAPELAEFFRILMDPAADVLGGSTDAERLVRAVLNAWRHAPS